MDLAIVLPSAHPLSHFIRLFVAGGFYFKLKQTNVSNLIMDYNIITSVFRTRFISLLELL